MTAKELEDWTPIPSRAKQNPAEPFSPSQLPTPDSSPISYPMPSRASVSQADEKHVTGKDVGFFSQHRTVEDRFRFVFPGDPEVNPTSEALTVSFAVACAWLLVVGFFYLFRWATGSVIKLPRSFAELIAFSATLWRWSYIIATWPVWAVQVCANLCTLFMAAATYVWSFLAIGLLGGAGAFLGGVAVLPPTFFVVWSVTLHEWTILKILPANLVSPPIAYTIDHLLLLPPAFVLARYLPSFLTPFTHPILTYPLIFFFLASAALECTIPEVFNYPFDRFERILAEHLRQLQEHEDEQRLKVEEARIREEQKSSRGRAEEVEVPS